MDVTPPIGVPLGGYGGGKRRRPFYRINLRHKYTTFFTPSKGILDPIRSKALVLTDGEKKIAFISVDVVGVTAEFHRDVVARLGALGFKSDQILLSATHTHSGPGTLAKNWFWELLAMDRHRPKVYKKFLDGIYESVKQALVNSTEADLYQATFQAKGIQRNRRRKGAPVEDRARILLARDRASGEWLGGMINFAVHGTAMSLNNLHFSADVPGGIERAMERSFLALNGAGARVPRFLFVNGAEGDVAPSHSGVKAIAELGESFAEQALQALPQAKPVSAQWQVRSEQVYLGKASARPLNCLQGKQRKWISKFVKLGVGALPRETRIYTVRLGEIAILTWPGEPTTDVGFRLQEAALKAGLSDPWILGLTNGHLAYFTTPEEQRMGGYEACMSLYGPRSVEHIIDGFKKTWK